MKRLIDLPDDVVKAIQNGEDYRYDIHTAIAQSIPYNPTGDLISRESLKKALELEYDDALGLCSDEVLATIKLIIKLVDNAQAVPL